MATSKDSPLASGPNESVEWNFKLIGHHELLGFGGMGEGMTIQVAPDGRRIMWLAHESAPKNFTGVDVSDPRNPKVVCQTDLPHGNVRSNSIEMTGNILAVAYQTKQPGMTPAGMDLFDVSKPEEPKLISFFDCSGPKSRGVHQLWFCDGEYVHMAAGADDFIPNNQLDDQCYRIIDVRNPSKPHEVGRWWLPGTRQGDNVAQPVRHKPPLPDSGFRAPQYECVSAAPGSLLLRLSRWRHADHRHFRQNQAAAHQPLGSFAALFGLHPHAAAAVRAQSSGDDRRIDGRRRGGLAQARVDDRQPRRNQPGADRHLSAAAGRNLCEPRRPLRCAQSLREHARPAFLVFGGCDRRHPSSTVACAPTTSPIRTSRRRSRRSFRRRRRSPRPDRSSLNDVFIDEREIVYTVDRQSGGLYILEKNF